MPDVFALAGTPALTRLRIPELAIAVAEDGDDARQSAIGRLTTIQTRLGVELGVIEALEGRLRLRRPLPPLPPVESLQSLVRRGRRRLERERQGGARNLHDVRLAAATRLRAVLEA
jgi:hypothetical protein